MKKLEKCVKIESNKLDFIDRAVLETCCDAYLKCKNYFFDLLCGDKYMVKIQNAKKLRTELSQKQKQSGKSYQELFHIPQRYWVMPLFEVCSNLNANWSNLKKFLKIKIRENSNLIKDEKLYCYIILNDRQLWYDVLHWKKINDSYLNSLQLNISDKRKNSLNNLIRRLTKENMFKKPHSQECNCISLDSDMYSFVDKFGITRILFSTIKKNQMLSIKLKGLVKFPRTGNLQIIYKRNKNVIELHKCIKTKTLKKKKKVHNSIDKGYWTLLSANDEKEYGEGIGRFFTYNSEWLNHQTQIRNFYLNLCKDLNMQKESLLKQLNTTSVKKKQEITHQIQCISKKINHIQANNLSQKHFKKEYNKNLEHCKQQINHAILQFFSEHDIGTLGVEDLSFVNYMSPYKGNKFNRKMSYWLKGYLDKRLEYISKKMGCEMIKVNAAYTSQFCAECGAKLAGRMGTHHEIALCPNCGKINANTNSAKNVDNRLSDKEITIYTPYKQVEKILLNRYKLNYKGMKK